MTRRPAPPWETKAVAIAVILAAWQLAAIGLGSEWIPSPTRVLLRTLEEGAALGLMKDLLATSCLVLAGLVIGGLLGVACACLLRLSPRVDRMVQPFITLVMSVPKLALVPLLVLWFGTGWTPKVMLVVLTSLFIVFAMTYSGLVTVQPRLVMMARVMGAGPRQVTQHIVLPTIWPFVLTGIEVALPWAVSAAIVSEYLAAKAGIGHFIENAQQQTDAVGVFQGILVATVLVVVLNAIVARLRRASARASS